MFQFQKITWKIIFSVGIIFSFLSCLRNVSFGQEISDTRTLNALNILERRSESGNLEAQYRLGIVYWYGIGVPQDYTKAVYWLEKAAFQGKTEAEDFLGMAYESGMGDKKVDFVTANEWFEKSALRGDSAAQVHLGKNYLRGYGVNKDCKQAIYWLEKSAKQNNSEAEIELGMSYENGECVEKNFLIALSLYKKACEHSDGACKENDEIACSNYEELKKLNPSLR